MRTSATWVWDRKEFIAIAGACLVVAHNAIASVPVVYGNENDGGLARGWLRKLKGWAFDQDVNAAAVAKPALEQCGLGPVTVDLERSVSWEIVAAGWRIIFFPQQWQLPGARIS